MGWWWTGVELEMDSRTLKRFVAMVVQCLSNFFFFFSGKKTFLKTVFEILTATEIGHTTLVIVKCPF